MAIIRGFTSQATHARLPAAAGRWLFAALVSLACVCAAHSQENEPKDLDALEALEKSLTQAIAQAEGGVVAVARFRKDDANPSAGVPGRPGLNRPGIEIDPERTRPDSVPHDFGSGVVVDSKGLILTTYHVAGDARGSEYVVWIGKKPYPAQVRAADPWLDLAVLKIDATDLTTLPLADGASVRKGQFVIALGNPYAIARDGQPSASWGIISNLARPAPLGAERAPASEERGTLHHYGNLIQTDAKLELGASGGALINRKGELIGLTVSLAALSGYDRSGGFAIPVDEDFRRALETLKAGRVPDYGFLGVSPTFLTAAERRQGRHGARILDVVPATPAARAGLAPGDVITHIGGNAIADDLDLIRQVGGKFADSQTVFTLERGGAQGRPGRVLEVNVLLSKKRSTPDRPIYREVADPLWRGLRVDYATAAEQFREQSRDLDPEGCLAVMEVEKDSPSWQAGLRPGDFISFVGRNRVSTPKQFTAAVAGASGPVAVRLCGESAALRTINPN